MADITLNTNIQNVGAVTQKPQGSVAKAAEAYKISDTANSNVERGDMSLKINGDELKTEALYVVTPDGVMHVRKTNQSGETEYSPAINIHSYSKVG